MVSKRLYVKTILTNHGILPEIGKLHHFAAEYIIAVNEHIVEYVLNNNIKDKDHVKLIRNGIPFDKTLKRKVNPKLKFIAASRLVYEKGLDIYIKAVSLLPEEIKNKAEFYLAGEGEYENELLLLNIGHKAGINFLGPIKELSKELYSYDVFIMPSRSKSEGFPLTVVEAGFAKNIIIISNFVGLNHVFEDNKDGIVFYLNNYKDLYEKIKNCIENKMVQKQYAEAFHFKARSLFNLNDLINHTLDSYIECIKS